jgi:hypothetical protein
MSHALAIAIAWLFMQPYNFDESSCAVENSGSDAVGSAQKSSGAAVRQQGPFFRVLRGLKGWIGRVVRLAIHQIIH